MAEKPKYQVQCGDIDGVVQATSPGAAFRKLLRQAKKPVALGVIARFCRVDPGRTRSERLWRYQEPDALEASR